MTREELENRVHEFTVQIYKEGFEDGSADVKTRVEGAYEKGLEDAWKCSNKINGMKAREFEEVFGFSYYAGCMGRMSPSEAMQKIKEYEERQKQDATDINDGSIKVGDEIYSDETDMTAVVHHIDAWGRYQCFNENGAQFVLDKETYDEYWHKTYKYYPQITEILRQLRGEI